MQKFDWDVVFRKHQSQKSPMKKGKIIGECDKIVTWYKPKKRPQGLSKEEFDILPQTITVREIYYCIFILGFRTQKVILITTLLDKATYSTLDIVELYSKRWKVIAHKAVPSRPGRSEVRICKRRPKAYPLMTKPRHELRTKLQTA